MQHAAARKARMVTGALGGMALSSRRAEGAGGS